MIISRAPLRISFGGGGTDLPVYADQYGGLVISTAIRTYCTVTIDESGNDQVTVVSRDYGQVERRALADTAVGESGVLCLPWAAITLFVERGLLTRGALIRLTSDALPGSGLGASSAMALALIHALATFTGSAYTPAEAADLACQLEIERLGMPIGKQDQYASAFGGLNRITFDSTRVRVDPLILSPDRATALEQQLLLFATGQRRNSATILAQQAAATRSDPAVVAALHQIKALAEAIQNALQTGDLATFGALLDQSWQHKRSLTESISSRAIDTWYAAARAAGALGGKITGAGGGGHLMLCCPPEHQRAVHAAMNRCGLHAVPVAIAWDGAGIVMEDQSCSRPPSWSGSPAMD